VIALSIGLTLVAGAVLGWAGCYWISVRGWEEKAFSALQMAEVYGACFLKSHANPDCLNCKGEGFLPGEFISPCERCEIKAEIKTLNGNIISVTFLKG